MINKDRIVPVTKTDLLTLYSVIFSLSRNGENVTPVEPDAVDGHFTITLGDVATQAVYMPNQPVKSLNVVGGVGFSAMLVADYDFKGIQYNGVDIAFAEGSDAIVPDAVTPYMLLSADGSSFMVKKLGI